MTHICVVKMTIIGSDNGLSPGRRQAIIWTNAEILLIGPLETIFIEILIGIQTVLFKKMHLKMSSAKWRPFCLGLNVLIVIFPGWHIIIIAQLTNAMPSSAETFHLMLFALQHLGLHLLIYLVVWFAIPVSKKIRKDIYKSDVQITLTVYGHLRCSHVLNSK